MDDNETGAVYVIWKFCNKFSIKVCGITGGCASSIDPSMMCCGGGNDGNGRVWSTKSCLVADPVGIVASCFRKIDDGISFFKGNVIVLIFFAQGIGEGKDGLAVIGIGIGKNGCSLQPAILSIQGVVCRSYPYTCIWSRDADSPMTRT